MRFAELFREFDRKYNCMAEFVGGLSEGQLSRKTRIFSPSILRHSKGWAAKFKAISPGIVPSG